MLDKKYFQCIGKVGRPHGLQGEVACKIDIDLSDVDIIGNSFFLMLEEEGLLIPYRVLQHRLKGNDLDLVLFSGINSKEAAEQLSHQPIFIDLKDLQEIGWKASSEYTQYLGYTVVNAQTLMPLGEVVEVDESTLNKLLIIKSDGEEELILPISESLIVDRDPTRSTITLHIPEGLT